MVVPRFLGAGEIDFVERPVPEPGPGQLLVRVRANALCGSERGQFFEGSAVTPGHEAAGVVADSGTETRTAVGTAGVIYLMDYCGECRSCALGLTNQCLNKRGDVGFNRDGGYGPYVLVNENVFFPTGADISPHEATMLLDVMGTTRHAIERGLRLHEDVRSLGIAGAGPVGLGALAMAKILLGRKTPVVVSDYAPYRLGLAKRLGADVVDLREETIAGGVRDYGLDTIDLAIDTSGKAAARRSYLGVLGKRGVLVCAGHGEDLALDVSRDLIAPERAVLGSEYFRYDELASNLGLLREHRPYLGVVIPCVQTHALRLLLGRLGPFNHDVLDRCPHQFHIVSVRTVNCQADRHAVALGQQTAFDAGFTAVGGIWPGLFPPQAALWSSPHPYSTTTSQCPVVQRTVRRRPARASETPLPRPIRRSGRGRSTWRTIRSRSARPTGRQCAARRRWQLRTVGQAPVDGHPQNDACLSAWEGAAPSPPPARLRSESPWSSCCLGYERASASSVFLCSYPKVYRLFG